MVSKKTTRIALVLIAVASLVVSSNCRFMNDPEPVRLIGIEFLSATTSFDLTDTDQVKNLGYNLKFESDLNGYNVVVVLENPYGQIYRILNSTPGASSTAEVFFDIVKDNTLLTGRYRLNSIYLVNTQGDTWTYSRDEIEEIVRVTPIDFTVVTHQAELFLKLYQATFNASISQIYASDDTGRLIEYHVFYELDENVTDTGEYSMRINLLNPDGKLHSTFSEKLEDYYSTPIGSHGQWFHAWITNRYYMYGTDANTISGMYTLQSIEIFDASNNYRIYNRDEIKALNNSGYWSCTIDFNITVLEGEQ